MPSLILLRGLPGAGKSTLANLLSESGKYPVFSVDDYFTDASGNYAFDFKNNHLAYKACETNTRKALEQNTEKVFVHNTFTMDWEMQPYLEMAKEFNCQLHVVTVENYHGTDNIHDVSKEQLQKMADKYKLKLL